MTILSGISEESDDSLTPIQSFYANTNIFITGGTGFLGRILLEKLLRSCPQLKSIYLLVRQKKGKDVNVRLDELFDDVIFTKVKTQTPNFREKIIPIVGNSELPKLGITEEDKILLQKEINIVFHAAATVNFDEKLKKASYINIRGTRDLLELCGKMENLKFLTHVSTAYTHCNHRVLEEKFYDAEYSSQQVLTVMDNLNEETVDKITKVMLNEMPNTYTFTKSISEDLIRNSSLPVAVFRPAIIVSTYKEPLPGWINNYYGPQGVSTAAYLGLLRSLHCDKYVNANIVPVDMCVNALIALPWQCRQKYDEVQERNKNAITEEEKVKYEIPICFYESNTYQPINWKMFRYYTQLYGKNYASNQMIGMYFFHLRKSRLMHNIATIFLHYLPALFFDFGLICTGNKPKLFKGYKKIHNFTNVLSYFSSKDWQFKSNNLAKLCEFMSEKDKDLFFCDLTKLDWNVFFQKYLLGCRRYLLKEDDSTIEVALKKYQKLKIITVLVLVILAGLVLLCLKKLLELFHV